MYVIKGINFIQIFAYSEISNKRLGRLTYNALQVWVIIRDF